MSFLDELRGPIDAFIIGVFPGADCCPLPREGPAGKLGQLLIIAGRQIDPDFSDLFSTT
jgi:hypothetical protein